MTLSDKIQSEVRPLLMLKHPFYQAWLEGTLPMQNLRQYAAEYKDFVDQFPRLVSRIHSQCADAQDRKTLLTNLMEEEGFPQGEDHPALWKKFARGIGTKTEDYQKGAQTAAAEKLVEVFWKHCDSSYEEGLAALYTYEHQIPAIAEAKIEGLKQRYNIHDEDCLEFFKVHEEADHWHSQACANLINKIPEDKKEKALTAARECAEALWDFLSACEPKTCSTPA